MSVFETLSAQELAAQLRDPMGSSGLVVANALDAVNREGNAGVVASLELTAGDRVLEVGCGLASMAPAIVGAAERIRYTGLDQSDTMIAAASERHAELVRAGKVNFHLARVEQMPFEPAQFDKVFSVGVMHFWENPVAALAQIRRVTGRGGRMAMAGLGPRRAPAFAQQEHGFHLRDPDSWRAIAQEAGWMMAEAISVDVEGRPEGIYLTARA